MTALTSIDHHRVDHQFATSGKYGWMDEWMDGWMDECMDGSMDGCSMFFVC